MKTLGIVLLALAAVGAAAITATIGWRPFFGPAARSLTDRRFEATPARLERGAYLVNHVTGCLFCHSELDADVRGLPPVAAGAGAGHIWVPEGMPWLVSSNITPDAETGAGRWSDDQIARAVREGVGHDGRALFPVMPYMVYRRMSDEDLAATVVYLRTLKPVRRELPRAQIPFPASRMINLAPEPITAPIAAPDSADEITRGEYLTTIAGCGDCHSALTPEGARVPGLTLAGGNIFKFEGKRSPVAAANLTPSVNGIPYYTEELFIETIRTGRVRARELSDLMPWSYYAGMTDADLKAIFAYLKTVPAVDHYVDNAMKPALCARCNIVHGGGERNKPAS